MEAGGHAEEESGGKQGAETGGGAEEQSKGLRQAGGSSRGQGRRADRSGWRLSN